jgi:uncharacterized membrane protein
MVTSKFLNAALLTSAGAVTAAASVAVAQPATFIELGVLPGESYSTAAGVSGDGAVVVGRSGDRAFRWTLAGGMQELVPPAGMTAAAALAVSADGSTIAGYAWSGAVEQRRAAIWTSAGPQLLETPPGWEWSEAAALSADGSIAVGTVGLQPWSDRRAVRWGASPGVEVLGEAPSAAYAVSADGSIVGGMAATFGPGVAPWAALWTASSGWSDLGVCSGCNETWVRSLSADGSVAGGFASTPIMFGWAFRWSSLGGPHLMLDWVNGGHVGAVSGDGRVLAGAQGGLGSGPALLWTPTRGSMNLGSVLQSLGVSLPGPLLGPVNGLNADGSVLVGGFHYQWGIGRAWRATIPVSVIHCYANCDFSTTPPLLNIDDFTCFINQFAAASTHWDPLNHYANCDGSTTAQVLNVDDFTCFINRFAAGCP